ncbi:MAG: ABC transporter transmembrane domain-containing protein, partial [Acidobacteriota bacterium]
SGGKVRINDPAAGPLVITEEELDASFTGVAVKLDPGPDFEPGGDAPRLMPALARRLVGLEGAIGFVLLTGLALVLPGLVTPVYTKLFVDQVLLRDFDSWVRPLLLAMGITGLLFGVLTWMQQAYLLRLETKMAVSSSAHFFWHVLRMPMDFFAQRMTGDISSRVAANDNVARLLSRDLATNLLGSFLIVFYATLMFQYDVALTVVGIVIVSLNVAALRLVSRRRTDANRQLLQEQGKLSGTALGGLKVIETLKAQGGESDLFSRWSGYQTKVVNIRQKLEQLTQVLVAVPPLLAALTTAIILGFGSLRVIEGVLTLGSLVAFQALMRGFSRPVQNMVSLGSKLQNVEGDMNRIDDVMRYPVDPGVQSLDDPEEAAAEGEAGAEGVAKLSGWLEIKDLSFGYSPLSPPLIKDFHLSLEPGSRVALIGGSGSGKSTVAMLVNGLFQPWSGEILFDGRPRSEIARPVMTASVASVDQTVSMFEGTIRENLTLWNPTLPLSEVVAAARDAQIHDDIAS